jgi:hypothetical protein
MPGADPDFWNARWVHPLKKGTHGGAQPPLAKARNSERGSPPDKFENSSANNAFSWHLGIRFHIFPSRKKAGFFYGENLGFVQ